MPCRIPNLGQRSAAGQRMTDKRVPAVVDGHRFKPGSTGNFARGPKSLAEIVARERLGGATSREYAQQRWRSGSRP
jgi:hypothetical protein